jgi:DNA-binding winged helix-turn-helix (wHTH) protein
LTKDPAIIVKVRANSYSQNAAAKFRSGRSAYFRRSFFCWKADKPVSLGSRAMHILIVLLERPGELVTKQELMARVWPDLFVEPANLPVNIAALRRALRDGRDGNRFIINIRGRGYCFVDQIRVSGHEN